MDAMSQSNTNAKMVEVFAWCSRVFHGGFTGFSRSFHGLFTLWVRTAFSSSS